MQKYLNLVKFSHSIFAMPFAILGFGLGSYWSNRFSCLTLIFIVLCMIFARNAAMAFNRWLDRDIDSLNFRTQTRELVTGEIRAIDALMFVLINCVLFVLSSFFISQLCFALSPVALTIILGYSYTKRFTPLCHLILGIGLALAPVGAFIAVANNFTIFIIILSFSVLCWVAGFDILYSLQDRSFDKENSLKSIPVVLGLKGALISSRVLHIICAILLFIFIILIKDITPFNMGNLSWFAYIFFVASLIYQHRLIKSDDLSKIDLAFFTTNGIASLVFCIILILDLVV